MSQVKLFSSSGGARVAKRSGRQKKQKVKKPLKMSLTRETCGSKKN